MCCCQSESLKSGWGTRLLSRNDTFRIWGHTELCISHISREEIMDMISAQPLGFLMYSFMKSTQQAEGIQIQSKRPSYNMPTDATYFLQLDIITNHNWSDPDISNYNNHKADKSLVPSDMWDQRINLAFHGHCGTNLRIKTCCTILLRSYRRILLISFLEFVDLVNVVECSNHKSVCRKF